MNDTTRISHPRCTLTKTTINNAPEGLTITGWKYELITGYPKDAEDASTEKTTEATRTFQMEMMNMERALIQICFIGQKLYEHDGMHTEEIEEKVTKIMKEIR